MGVFFAILFACMRRVLEFKAEKDEACKFIPIPGFFRYYMDG